MRLLTTLTQGVLPKVQLLNLLHNLVVQALPRKRLASASSQPPSSGCFDSEPRMAARLSAQHDNDQSIVRHG
jgi:hypothetical protein